MFLGEGHNLRLVFAAVVLGTFVGAQVSLAVDAPGGPGEPSRWATAVKDFLGTATTDESRLYFTGAEGVVTEIFYPTLDNAQQTDLQFIVLDAAATWNAEDAEERRQTSQSHLADSRAMIWDVTTIAKNNKWKIVKKIFADPDRNVLIERVTFQTLEAGKSVSDYDVYVLSNPAINRNWQSDNGRTLTYDGRVMLVASEPDSTSSALAISLPWKRISGQDMISSGFVGRNDGWSDLFSGSNDRKMDWQYAGAYGGNIAQMGWIDFGGSAATSISFDLVLSFGGSELEAATSADAALDTNLDAIESAYVNGWHNYCNGLDSLGGSADDQYYLAAMTLKTCQDKSTGAMIAGAGIPWGEIREDPKDFYAYVWSRDLFKFASSLLAAGDKQSARRAVDFLFLQQMEPSGRFPQKTFVNGDVEWNDTQMDQTAMPIILAWRIHQAGELDLATMWPRIKMAAGFLADNGPRTPKDRWEEVGGYSPSTIAAEIAGMVCAGSLAQAAGDPDAKLYFTKADEWRNNVANWTFTTNGQHGDHKYFIRINTDLDPNDDDRITLGNQAGDHGERWIVDGGFLELVRMGAMSPNDWTILATIPEYDAILKQSINGHDAFFRYNYDGYGENNDGSSYRGGGRGRLWPIFSAERGIYEIQRSGDGAAGEPYKAALKAFSSTAGLIPEQVWNYSAEITGWNTATPNMYEPGTSTRSIRPLNWAMGEYVNLVIAMHRERSDAPEVVVRRYATDSPQSTVTFTVHAETEWGQDIYLLGDHPLLGNWVPEAAIKLSPTGYPAWSTTLSLPSASAFRYKFVKRHGTVTKWESGENRVLNTPSTGTMTVSDVFQ